MSKKLAYERCLWFHNEVKQSRFPNAAKLAQEFEISSKQAQRDIDFIRDRLYAPLRYDSKSRGYCYDVSGYELPSIWIKEDELLALCLAAKLASNIPQGEIKKSLDLVIEKFSGFLTSDFARFKQFINNVLVKNIEYYRVEKTIFQQVISSLFNQQAIEFDYYSPHKKENSHRIVKPMHLLCYMGRWFLIGYCKEKAETRYFSLSRISAIKTSDEHIDIMAIHDIKTGIDNCFGILTGGIPQEVCLRFKPEISDWIKEQIWHEAQIMSDDEDGRLSLKIPAANFAELKGEILKFGSAIEVVSPEALRVEIKEEIKKMSNIYK